MKKMDREFDLRDMLFYIIKKWRILSFLALLGMIAGGTAAYIEYKENRQPPVMTMGIERAMQYDQEIKDYEAYLKDSCLMNIDPLNMYQAELIFNVYGSDILDAAKRASILAASLNGDEICSVIPAVENISSEELDLPKVVDVAMIGTAIRVTVGGKDEAECRAISDEVKKAFGQKLTLDSVIIHEFELELVSETIQNVSDAGYLQKQRGAQDKMELLETEKRKIIAAFGEKEREDYYRFSDMQNGLITTVSFRYIKMILGFIMGILGAAVLLAIYYLLGGKLHCPQELRAFFGHDIYMVDIARKKKFFGKLDALLHKRRLRFENVITGETAAQDLADAILMNADREGKSSIYITGNLFENSIKELLENIKDIISTKGIQVNWAENLLKQRKIRNEIDSVETVYLVETIDKSYIPMIESEIETLAGKKIYCIGIYI